MPNDPGLLPPDRFREGVVLGAGDMNRILRMLLRRIVGGKGIRVRVFTDQIIIEMAEEAGATGAGTGVQRKIIVPSDYANYNEEDVTLVYDDNDVKLGPLWVWVDGDKVVSVKTKWG